MSPAPPIDASNFQVAPKLVGEDDEDTRRLRSLAVEADAFVRSQSWAPPLENLYLAFGVGGVIGLFLARFTRGIGGQGRGDLEVWVVVGDMPMIYFETEDSPTPAHALETYCCIAEQWADHIIAGSGVSECYPIPVEPTREHAEMLKSRIASIREMFIPIA
jgi:hypothetical protein